MSLRIPLTPDQTLQTEFHEIERRLRKLEKATGTTASTSIIRVSGGGGGSTVNLQPILDRLETLEQIVAEIPVDVEIPDFKPVGSTAANGLVPSPGTPEPPTGVAQHVLTEDNEWGFPLRGLIGVSTSGEQTDPPYDVVNLQAGLQVGHVTASDLECFNFRTHADIEYCDSFFDDLRIEPVARTTGANAPAFQQYADDSGLLDTGTSRGVYLYSFDNAAAGSEKEVHFTMQMPHSWKLGTSINMHVHWIGGASDTTAAPRWGLEYTFKSIGQTFGATATIYSTGLNIDASGGYDANITAGKHYISEFAPITPGVSASGLSAILIGRLFRDSANAADTYDVAGVAPAGATCGLLYIDAHYEIDSPGSSAEYTK